MIQISDLVLRRGPKVLLQHTNLTVYPQERIGIVGPNGAGKSSLFALIHGSIEADQGTVQLPADWRIAQVEQQIRTPEREAIEFVIDGDHHLRSLQKKRAQVDLDDGQAIALLETALNDAGAWSARSRAEQLLTGLGFNASQWQLPVQQFSGGWQMRLALARALMMPSDLLLLDEPTNHLDLDAMLWLERWLTHYEGTVLIISHDTEFLDAVATHIIHFEGQKLHRYRGNYTQFQRQHSERQRLQEANIAKQEQRAAHLQRFINRFRAQASKARQAQSRIKALERMQSLQPVIHEQSIDIHFPDPDFMPDPLLRLQDAQLGYQGEGESAVVLSAVNLSLRAGSRIGILGMNGTGKSTLIKTLAGILPLLQGERIAAQRLSIGYFAQHQLDVLDENSSPLAHLQRLAPEQTEQSLRSYLGRFGFSAQMAVNSITHFSGGEKARLALALIVWDEPNLLLLDEPTNHLDIDTRNALINALTEYQGSVLIVSHDRQLLRQTVDEFWLVSQGQLQPFDGDLEDYKQWFFAQQAKLQAQQKTSNAATTDEQTTSLNRREQRQQAAAQRQRAAKLRRPLEQEVKKIEAALNKKQKEHNELLELMGQDEFYSEAYASQRADHLARAGQLGKEIESLEERWLQCQEQLEAISADNV